MAAQTSIAGGYVLIPTRELCMAWTLYHTKAIRLADLRVWFACKELVERRKFQARNTIARFELAELHRLVGGVGGEHLRASLRRLEQSGLLRWSERAIVFATSAEDLGPTACESVARMIDKTSLPNRRVPIPRRHLRFMAGGCRRAVIATLLAHLMRCLFVKQGEIHPRGFCKASWIVDLFGVSERNIKDARKHLEQIGILHEVPMPQWRLNRLGKCHAVNLSWARTVGERARSESTPPLASSTTRSAPPESNKKLLTDLKNQKPASRGMPGICEKKRGERRKPNLASIVPADLSEVRRTLALFQQAVARNLVNSSESAKLQFFAAAAHAKIIGTRNPCGLFAAIVRRKLWHVITQSDEDLAQFQLRQLRDARARNKPITDVSASTPDMSQKFQSLLGAIMKKSSIPQSRSEISAFGSC